MTEAPDSSLAQTLSLPAKRAIFGVIMCCVFLAMLDSQIVAMAMPTIVAEFGGMEQYGWVSSAYLITHSAIMPICGKLGDLFGRKQVLLASVLVFLLGSLACGLVPSMDWLIAARLFQGLGAGGIIVTAFALNGVLFAPRERAKYQSFSSLVLLLSAAVGPVLGGVMTQYWGWRSIFLINLPIGLLAVALLVKILPSLKPTRRPVIDYAGAALITAIVSGLVIWSDSPQIFGGFLTASALGLLAALVGMVALFLRVARRAPEPVIPLAVIGNRVIWRLLAISVGTGSIALGMANFHALYMQKTTGLSPATAGLFFIALMTGISLGSVTSGRWIARTGTYRPVMSLGLAGCSLGFGVLALLPVGQAFWLLVTLYALLGFFSGLGQQVPTLLAQLYAPAKDIGATTGTVSLFRLAGAAVATSIYGALLNQGLAASATGGAMAADYGRAFLGVYGLASGVMALCCLIALSLPDRRD